MAQEGGRTMPFGYDFRQDIAHIQPQPPPSGPPLLTAEQGSMMENFFDNPNLNFDVNDFNTMAFNGNPDIPVWPELFGEQEGILAAHYNMSTMSSPVEHRPQSRQEQPMVRQEPSMIHQQQSYHPPHRREYEQAQNSGAPQTNDNDYSNLDEGRLGASALVNLFHEARGSMMPRRQSEISSGNPTGSASFNHHVLSAERYTPTTNPTIQGLHMPTHANSLNNFTSPGNFYGGSAITSHGGLGQAIPSSLQFNTDMNFTRPARGSHFGYIPTSHTPTDEQRALAHMTYSGDYSPAANHNSSNNSPSSLMAPPSRTNGTPVRPHIQRTNTGSATTPNMDEQAAKRRRTQSFPQATTQPPQSNLKTPIKQEVTSPAAESSASTPSASHSDSPRRGRSPKSSSKRRTSTTGPSAAATASAAKRAKLSDAQRKENHIQSEKRRRAEMKKGYDQLDRLVPSLKAGTLSKAQVLQHTVVFLEAVLSGNDIAEARLAELEARSNNHHRSNTAYTG
ncbi:hypothetical protein KVT40_005109 [Elsinoe batatas]|uniref:BHLH domain-containing protein n=1 Tax=Elsinoe batatas TaxID=2601811 RepID=A0A8K0L0I2_9PEZI|nr:hypothetical protein KVT40_005109 [Elsinoe batatas]